MSKLPYPTEIDCLLANLVRRNADALGSAQKMKDSFEVIAKQWTADQHDAFKLVRGALSSIAWQLTDSQYQAARLATLLRQESTDN